MLAVQVRTGIAIRFPPGWDAGIMEILAHGLAYEYLPPERAVLSIDQYPNNALLTALLTRWLELCRWGGVDDYELQFVGINALRDVRVDRRGLRGRPPDRVPAAAYVTLFLAGALLTLSPWIGVAYSDTLGMIFPITIAWLYVRLRAATVATRGRRALVRHRPRGQPRLPGQAHGRLRRRGRGRGLPRRPALAHRGAAVTC